HEIAPRLNATTHVLCQGRSQFQCCTQRGAPALQVCVAAPEPVQRELFKRSATQQAVWHKRPAQHVALECQTRLQIHAGPDRPGEAVQVDRWFVPPAVQPAFQVVEDLPAIEYRDRVAERERLNGGGGLVGGNGCFGGHHIISIMLVFWEVAPSRGSLCSAWNSAHARSAWPVSSVRPAV